MTEEPRRMSAAELDELERLARKATPGPWRADGDQYGADIFAGPEDHTVTFVAVDHEGLLPCVRSGADAAYIAALSPDVVLRLLAAARATTEPETGLRTAFEKRLAAIWDKPSIGAYDALAADLIAALRAATTGAGELDAAEQRGYERRLVEENRARVEAEAPRPDQPEPAGYGAMHAEADEERALAAKLREQTDGTQGVR